MRYPSCERAVLRPHVVWFGEVPFGLDSIAGALGRADLFVAIGTSGAGYPAAGLAAEARAAGIPTCEINLKPSDNADQFDTCIRGPAGEMVPAWVNNLLGRA